MPVKQASYIVSVELHPTSGNGRISVTHEGSWRSDSGEASVGWNMANSIVDMLRALKSDMVHNEYRDLAEGLTLLLDDLEADERAAEETQAKNKETNQ